MKERLIIAIIGRPNVGKSSLFNALLRRREAIISPLSGTTRDRIYASVDIDGTIIDVVDTAGLSADMDNAEFGLAMLEQVQLAVKEADGLVFVVDGKTGLTNDDQAIAELIRRSTTPAVIFVNKVDNLQVYPDNHLLNLGIGETVVGSLTQRRGKAELIAALQKMIQPILMLQKKHSTTETAYPRVTLVGRPNVGKSTLYNTILGFERVIVSDIPGTTRDIIDTQVVFDNGMTLVITDTAGLRRRGKVGKSSPVERYSVLRTLRAIDRADLVLLIVDATTGMARGDAHIARYALEQNKRLITVINKVDMLKPDSVNFRRFPFLLKQPMIFVSAKKGQFIPELLELVTTTLRNSVGKQGQSS